MSWMPRSVTVLAALSAWAVACADPGNPPSFVGPLVLDVTTVSAPTYELSFSPTGVRMPDHLRIGQFEALATDVCNREGLIGVALFPALDAIAGNQGKMVVDSGVVDAINGSVVVKMHVNYTIAYDCPGPQQFKGETDFTFFPYGRIVRHDFNIEPSQSRLTGVQNCGCDTTGPNSFFLTSYYAFDPTGMQVLGNGTTVNDTAPGACTIYPGRGIGIAVNFEGATTRYRPNAAAAHVFDFISGEPTVETGKLFETHSAIQIGTGVTQLSDCQHLLDLLAVTTLSVDGDDVTTDDDGIFRDNKAREGTIEITPKGLATPDGWVTSLNLGSATHATVSRSPPVDGDEVLIQREASGTYLFSFKKGMPVGAKVTIEPRL